MNKNYLIICLLEEIIKSVGGKFNDPEFDVGYRLFEQTNMAVNYVDCGIISRQRPILVRSWFDEGFYTQPFMIAPPMNNIISKFIDDWGRNRARRHVLLIGRELVEYATEEMPCVVFGQEPLFFRNNCFCIAGWQSFALMLQNNSVKNAINERRSVADIIWTAVDNYLDAVNNSFQRRLDE